MPDITSYEQAIKWIKKGKSPEGRRVRSLMLRVNDDNVIIIGHAWRKWSNDGEKCTWVVNNFAELHPGDIFTFTRTSADMVRVSASLSSVLYKVFGLAWTRMGKGRYEVWHFDESIALPAGYYWMQQKNKNIPKHEHFKGMEWSLGAGVCLNPRTPVLAVVDKDARKVWMAALKKFRRALHTRVKIGMVQTIIDQSTDDAIYTTADFMAADVLEAIKTGSVHTDLLDKLVNYSKRQSYSRTTTNESVKQIAEGIINSNSVQFRQEFGVLHK